MIANGINYSSGINTESEAMEKNSNFPADRRGNILLWAGADSDSVEDIENAALELILMEIYMLVVVISKERLLLMQLLLRQR